MKKLKRKINALPPMQGYVVSLCAIATLTGCVQAQSTSTDASVQLAAATEVAPVDDWPPGGKAFLWNGLMPAIPQNKVQVTLHVNGASPVAANSNVGSASNLSRRFTPRYK
jgi:hypothetical protein